MNQGKKTRHNGRTPVIDWKLCVKLANNKVAVAQEILLFVIQHLPTDLEEIKQAQEKADYVELLRCVHKLHGALCYSGMPRLKNAVADLETVLKQDPFDDSRLRELSGHLEREAQAVLASKLPCE